ncbi:MAG TPA: lyase [Xanthobacteraceae bacterium]|jgi:virginiamycin B lyase
MKKTMLAALAALVLTLPAAAFELKTFPVNPGSRPHDVAVGADGIVWYTAQGQGALGRLDPRNGAVRQIKLGERSAPHGVVIGPDGAPWVTDSGLNAIVRVDPRSELVKTYPLPKGGSYANLNTLTFDKNGVVWFTGQAGVYGKADPKTGEVKVWDAPKGRGPYGIATTPSGEVWYSSLAGDHIAKIDTATGAVEVVDTPSKGAGARRVWSDSKNRLWVSLWNSGEVGLYDPTAKTWKKWKLPGNSPMAYSVYVDEQDAVWLTDFGSNTIVRFDPKTEKFQSFPGRNVRQMLGKPGEVWAPESGDDRIIGVRFGPGKS